MISCEESKNNVACKYNFSSETLENRLNLMLTLKCDHECDVGITKLKSTVLQACFSCN